LGNFDPKSHWEKILIENYGLQGTGYHTLGQNFNTWLYKIKLKAFIKTIKSLDIEDLSKSDVLDVGSGTGFFINAWKNLGVKSVTGFDITSVAIQNLKLRFPNDKFYQADISDTISDSKQLYDIVSSFDVLYHIVDDDRYRRAMVNIYY
jgi:2-polyprenyl-3-methyl-5-hydroxy-6-metoxy-1,4-benzoquinol methylase